MTQPKLKDRLIIAAGYATTYLGIIDIYDFCRRHLSPPRVPIIAYHRVGEMKYPWSPEQMGTADFEAEMNYLTLNYEVVSLQRIVRCLQEQKPLPSKAVVITFDDGYKDNYVNAYSILKKYHLPATIFLTTGNFGSADLFWWDRIRYVIWHTSQKTLSINELGTYHLTSIIKKLETSAIIESRLKHVSEEKKNLLIQKLSRSCNVEVPSGLGKDIYLSWDEIKEMNNNGIYFGSHTISHPILTKVPIETAKWEIVESKKRIEAELKQDIVAFSYPNGSPADYNNKIKQIVKNAGFACALTAFPPKLVSSGADLFELGRTDSASPQILKFSLGLLPDICTLLKR